MVFKLTLSAVILIKDYQETGMRGYTLYEQENLICNNILSGIGLLC